MEARLGDAGSTPGASALRKVAVIGGGLSGLAAAWRLRQAGCEVAVLERTAEPGGRLRGERIDGFEIESSLQVLRSNDAHLPGWIRELGLADELLPMRPVVSSGLHRGVIGPTRWDSVLGVTRTGGVGLRAGLRLRRLPRLMRRYGPLLDRDAPERAADWDFRSVADFARLYFGPSVRDYFMGPIAATAGRAGTQDTSRVAFLLAWLAEEECRFGVARRGLAELPRRAGERLGMHRESAAESVALRPGGGYVVRSARGEAHEVDVVVVATGPQEARRVAGSLLTAAEHDFFEAVRMGPECQLVVAVDRPPTGAPQYVRVSEAEGEIVDALLAEPGVADGRAPLGSGLVSLVGAPAFCEASLGTPDEVVEKELVATLERLLPSVMGTICHAKLYRRSEGLPRFEVGAYRALARFRRVQVDRRAAGRRLYFAGDYLSGASADQTVGSGFRAADEALADLGLSAGSGQR